MVLTFEPLADRPGLGVVDPVENRRYVLETDEPVAPEPVDVGGFPIPVDDVVAVAASTVVLPQVVDVFVRDVDGRAIADARPIAHHDLSDDDYVLELSAPIKLYVRVSGPVTVTAGVDEIRFEFGGATELLVGGRSYHQRPAATVTTTDDPRDVMTAVSALSSALKATSVERSFPTLRGHPPALERGDELAVPDGLDLPDTGVRIELPATRRYAYVAAPLSYYLGAKLTPGEEPRLVTDDGFLHSLGGERGFEGEVERVLKQTFLLDCLVRTEGFYELELAEREALEERVDVDFAGLYDLSLPRQLATYLSIPYCDVEPHLPRWALAAHLPPDPEHVEALPYVVNDLAVVRTARPGRVPPTEVRTRVLGEYIDARTRGTRPDGTSTREGSDAPAEWTDVPTFVRLPDDDAVERAWFGEHIPLNGSKAVTDAYRNALEREPTDGRIHLTVVCNDEGMDEESDVVNEVYGSREELPFDLDVHADLGTADLADVLETDADYLHYIGHIDAEGFRCADGILDAASLDAVGVDAFFLNACRSYEQGLALIERGGVGGVVTFSEVVNSGAVRVGHAMARLLNLGFPLRAALTIARGVSLVGGHYMVVGDGNADVAQVEAGVPTLCEVDAAGDDEFDITVDAYLPREGGMGTAFYPFVEQNGIYSLAPGRTGPFRRSRSELEEYFLPYRYPIRYEGTLHWSDDSLDL